MPDTGGGKQGRAFCEEVGESEKTLKECCFHVQYA